ncbi:MAG TPA: prepilin-type N-terminal cleavage/methylation domain-containing protein [Candidatus Dormibacteraeota bacterium]|nr:prepilin-type N-terminal cleavage/methylation domain-containing protein [Candidatus Dormibacteraeota bacterium]
MKHIRRTGLNQRAFTIIELMIATAVLSTILLLVTVMMMSIGNLYYKGVNQARIQDDARSIVDDVSQHLQLSDNLPLSATSLNGQIHVYCIGTVRYTYVLNRQIGTGATQSPDVLWRDDNPVPGSCATTNGFLNSPPPNLNGTELISPNSRLTGFSISASSPYIMSVGVAYGADDLLCDSGSAGDCVFQGLSLHMSQIISGLAPSGTILCKGNIGDQFCSTAGLTTTVVQRITGNGG